jgi:hypothetical protein
MATLADVRAAGCEVWHRRDHRREWWILATAAGYPLRVYSQWPSSEDGLLQSAESSGGIAVEGPAAFAAFGYRPASTLPAAWR